MRIQKRLLISILPVVFITVAAVVIVSMIFSNRILEKQVIENARLLSKSYSNQLNAKVVQTKKMSQDLASAVVTAINVETVLIDARKRYSDFSNIFYSSLTGSIKDMAPYSADLKDDNYTVYSEWNEAVETQSPTLTDPVDFKGNSVILIFSPVILDYVVNKQPEVIGMVTLVIPTERIFTGLTNVVYGDTGSLFIINSNGYFVLSKDSSHIMNKTVTDIPSTTDLNGIKDSMVNLSTGLATYYNGSNRNFISFSPVPEVNWALSITGSYNEFTKPMNILYLINISILFIGLTIALFVIYMIVRGVVRPINQLTSMAEKINKGDMNLRSNIKTRNEMGILSKAIDSMLERLSSYNKRLEIDVQERTKELQAANEELLTMNESMEAMNEELLATNEKIELKSREMEAMNEELKSTNESLDKNNREMEAMNEELITTNESLDKSSREIEAMNEELMATNETLDRNNKEMEAMNEELSSTVDQLDSTNRQLEDARNALWSEMKLAKKLQTVLLPVEPYIPGFDISAFMNTADQVGGDYYDVINVEGKDWFLIGDVSGHGVTAGLIMMMVQTSIHVALSQNPHSLPGELLSTINKTIHANISKLGGNRYMTLTVFACLDDDKFSFAGAHLPAIVYRKESDSLEMLETPGAWIGLVQDIDDMNHNNEFTMKDGDVLLLYTDGISEAITDTGEQFTQEALSDLFKSCVHLSSHEICEVIKDYSECLTMDDDVTVMVLKKVPS